MKALLIKEFLSLKTSFRAAAVIAVIFGVVGIADNSPSLFMTLPIMSMILISTMLAQDETAKWDKYVFSLPFDRAKMVSVKYVALIICSAASAAYVSICYGILAASGKSEFSGYELLIMTAGVIALTCIFSAFSIPVTYKFGAGIGRIMIIVPGALTGFLMTQDDFLQNIVKLYNENKNLIPVIVIIASVVILAVSWVISIGIFKKKDIA